MTPADRIKKIREWDYKVQDLGANSWSFSSDLPGDSQFVVVVAFDGHQYRPGYTEPHGERTEPECELKGGKIVSVEHRMDGDVIATCKIEKMEFFAALIEVVREDAQEKLIEDYEGGANGLSDL